MNFSKIEHKWQQLWQENNIFTAKEQIDLPKYYVLEMFPYPSGKIHVGHLRNYAIGDVIARFKRAQGFNVLHPMGWDAFGLPAENAAISNKIHPADWTYQNIDIMRAQLQAIGLSYDWHREFASCSPNYYKHEQKFFLEMLANNLAYQKESVVNWDPIDNTVLANEQVIDGKGWRSGAAVEKRSLKQWFLRITDYADELTDDLKQLTGWPENVRLMQENWIGKSIGIDINFKIHDSTKTINIYTTRPETIFGASFIAIAYNHPLVADLQLQQSTVDFINECRSESTATAVVEKKTIYGVKTNLMAVHPFDVNIKLPICIANFVLMNYGTGAVFGCPAHDERDYQLANLLDFKIAPVIQPLDGSELDLSNKAYIGDGSLINSAFLNGLSIVEGKIVAIEKLQALGCGSPKVNYRLHDWGISRQRFWGCPIPIIYCDTCGVVPEDIDNLPVELPKDVSFDISGNPLDHHPTWKYTICPNCRKPAERETDTFDTFFESSWYFTRFCNNNAVNITDKAACDYWLPVDQYIGGIEHAVLHLLYARFFNKVLCDAQYISNREPFKNLLTQGMVVHQTYQDTNGNWLYPTQVIKNGNYYIHHTNHSPVIVGKIEKMSKSKKNLVALDEIIANFGADTARLFVLSDSPPEKDLEWSNNGIEGCARYIQKIYNLQQQIKNYNNSPAQFNEQNNHILHQIHNTIKHVTDDIAKFKLNKAIARIRELTNIISDNINNETSQKIIFDGFMIIIRLLNPFIPHITEEIWQLSGNKIMLAQTDWPIFDETYLQIDTVTIAIQINGKLRATHKFPIDIDNDSAKSIVLALEDISKYIDGQIIKKIVMVPNKIINIVLA